MHNSGQRKDVVDGSQSNITEMEGNITRPECLIPPADQPSIHLLDAVDWAARKLTDLGVTAVSVGPDEVDLVEVERRAVGGRSPVASLDLLANDIHHLWPLNMSALTGLHPPESGL